MSDKVQATSKERLVEMTPVAASVQVGPAEEMDGAFDDLANVTDLRVSAAPERVRQGDTSKLLATINKTVGFSTNSAKEELERLEMLRTTAMHRMRQQPWYHNGKYLLIAGLMSVLGVGLITVIFVLLTNW